MPDDAPQLRPADRARLLHSLSHPLCHGRNADQQEWDDLVTRLAAEQVLSHLERSNSVVMKRPPPRAHSVGFSKNLHLTD